MNTPINKEATYMPGPVGKTFSEEEMLKINPHASKLAGNIMDGYVFVWNKDRELYENIGKVTSLLGRDTPPEFTPPVSFTMKGFWESDGPLPEEDAQVGDCWIRERHFWARTSQNVWKDYGDISDVGSIQYCFLEDNPPPAPRPVIFRNVDDHELTATIIGDFVNREIADAHAPEVGHAGEAYIADNTVFLWDVFNGTGWIESGKVGEIWEPLPPPTSGLADLFKTLPRSDIFNGDRHKDQRSKEQILQSHFHDDVRAGYGGTFEQWCSQNGDLNAVLRQAAGHDPQGPAHLRAVHNLEEQRVRIHHRDLLADAKAHPSLDDAEKLLAGALEKLEGEESDAAFKALDALKKVKKDMRRKRRNFWLFVITFWAIVAVGVYFLGKWLSTQVVTGRYTVPKTCSVPFGPGVIQGMRYYDYSYKSLFGVHMTLESTVRENTIVTTNGQEFSIFGLSPRNEDSDVPGEPMADRVLKAAEVEVETAPKPPKGKWWRMNIWTSDKGTQPMKPAELYLFASEKYTTMVAYKDFCK